MAIQMTGRIIGKIGNIGILGSFLPVLCRAQLVTSVAAGDVGGSWYAYSYQA